MVVYKATGNHVGLKLQLTFDFNPSSESTELLARVGPSLATKLNVYLQYCKPLFSRVLLILKMLNMPVSVHTFASLITCQLGDSARL